MQTSSTTWDTRTPAQQLVLNSRALFYRAASLPPSPSGVRPRGSQTSSPRTSFESTHSYSSTGTSEMRRGSEPTIERGRDVVRAGIAGRSQVVEGQVITPRASPSHIPTSSKAQRLLGLTHQLRKDSRFSASFDSDEDEEDEDARSFVDFGSNERDGDTSSSASNRLSLATTCSFNFAPVTPTRAARRDTPPSPTAYFTSFSASSSSFMPPAASANATGTTRSLDAASAPLLASRKGKASFSSQLPPPTQALPLPPTTNMLSTANRADLLRRHKKLQQVLGDGVAMLHPFANPDTRIREDAAASGNAWPTAQRDTIYLSASRRHSTPVSPTTPKRHSFDTASLASVNSYRSDASSFVDMDDDNEFNDGSKSSRDAPDHGSADSPPTPRVAPRPRQMDSVASFADSLSSGSTGSSSTRRNRHRGRSISVDVVPSSPGSPHSWVFLGTGAVGKGSLLADDDKRKRKRVQLAKLHRFLGSGVPAELALGITSPDEDLPPVAPEPTAEDGPGFKGWIRRINRPGSPRPSGTYSPPTEVEDSPLNAAELNDRERMINVKRAQKMEKACCISTSCFWQNSKLTCCCYCRSLARNLRKRCSTRGRSVITDPCVQHRAAYPSLRTAHILTAHPQHLSPSPSRCQVCFCTGCGVWPYSNGRGTFYRCRPRDALAPPNRQ